MCGASWSGRILCHPFLPSLPYPPLYTILTLLALPTITYLPYIAYLPSLPYSCVGTITKHDILQLDYSLLQKTKLCHNTLKSACVVCLFMAAFLLNILYCTYYIKRNLPFFLGSRYVECNMQGAVYSNTKPYNITPKGFPLCGVSSYA